VEDDMPAKEDLRENQRAFAPKSHWKKFKKLSPHEQDPVFSKLSPTTQGSMESLLAEPAGAELDSASCKYLSETFIGLCSQAITQAKESVKESEDIQMQD
jgi:hypothetical protein